MNPTLGSEGVRKLLGLCADLGVDPRASRAQEVFELMAESWAERSVALGPAQASDITDDHCPFEFSVAFSQHAAGARPELRFLVEAQASASDPVANWQRAWDLTRQLRARFGAHIQRAEAIADLFEPSDPNPAVRFSLWHATVLSERGIPSFKLYFNPQIAGLGEAAARTEAALRRLGVPKAWELIQARALSRRELDHVVFFSLDLVDGRSSRIKVYVAHESATASDVERVLACADDYRSGEARAFCRSMTGGEGQFGTRPLITCLAFSRETGHRPCGITLHLPIRCYVEDDQAAAARIAAALPSIQARRYVRALDRFTDRPLNRRASLQTYASVQFRNAGRRLTVYLSPDVYSERASEIDAGVPSSNSSSRA